jgi:hypothetical protein
MFGQLIDYWYYTNDSTYNNMVRDGILFQIGDQMNLVGSFLSLTSFFFEVEERALQSRQCDSVYVNSSTHNLSRCPPTNPKTRETTTSSSGLSA